MANTVEFKQPSEKISIGQIYTHNGEAYVLAMTSEECVALVCINDGRRWNAGSEVLDESDITRDEFCMICGVGDFVRVTSPITITPEA